MATGSGRRSKIAPETIDQAVKRYVEQGESVRVLAKYYKVAEPTIYLWVRKHQANASKQAKLENVSQGDLEKITRGDLAVKVKLLEKELRETREKLVARMIKLGEL